jgi:hypothetical protein
MNSHNEDWNFRRQLDEIETNKSVLEQIEYPSEDDNQQQLPIISEQKQDYESNQKNEFSFSTSSASTFSDPSGSSDDKNLSSPDNLIKASLSSPMSNRLTNSKHSINSAEKDDDEITQNCILQDVELEKKVNT